MLARVLRPMPGERRGERITLACLRGISDRRALDRAEGRRTIRSIRRHYATKGTGDMDVKLVFQFEGQGTEQPFELIRRMALPDRMPCIGEGLDLGGMAVARVAWILWRLGAGLSEVHLEPHPAYLATVSRQNLIDSGWHEE